MRETGGLAVAMERHWPDGLSDERQAELEELVDVVHVAWHEAQHTMRERKRKEEEQVRKSKADLKKRGRGGLRAR